jgi:hypothetical protein
VSGSFVSGSFVSGPLLALAAYGADERVATLFRTYAASDLVPARVVRVDRDRVLTAAVTGPTVAFGDPLPAVGDWVALDPSDPQRGELRVVLPRWSALATSSSSSPAWTGR